MGAVCVKAGECQDQTFPGFELFHVTQLLGQNKRIPSEIYLYLEGVIFFPPEMQ